MILKKTHIILTFERKCVREPGGFLNILSLYQIGESGLTLDLKD
jgi:hypothetical protein